MYKERIRSVGISHLGGNSGVEGAYELGIDSIRAVNEEDTVILGEPHFSRHRLRLTTQQKRILQRVLGGNETPSDHNTFNPCKAPPSTTHNTP